MASLVPIQKLQDTGTKLYHELAQHFSTNQLIGDTWAAMGTDLEKELQSLRSLPRRLWLQIRAEEQEIHEGMRLCREYQGIRIEEDRPFRSCLSLALGFEEPLILRVYAPILRLLRKEWTGEALDFYIMVKSRVTRLVRVTHSFSGDTGLIQRSSLLLERFEKQIQPPATEYAPRRSSKAPLRTVGQMRPGQASVRIKGPRKTVGTEVRTKHPRSEAVTKPAKRLIKKIAISQRRVRR